MVWTTHSTRKFRTIWSNPVISWNGLSSDGLLLGREIPSLNVFSSFMNPSFMKFLRWTCSLRLRFMNPLHSQLLGTSCMQVMLLPKIPIPKKLSEQIARFSTQKIDPATGVTPVSGRIFETKNRAIFLDRFFGRGIFAREQLSRAKNVARLK